MTYDSPSQIRKRQAQREKPRRPRRQSQIKISDSKEWAATQNFHLISAARGLREGDLSLAHRHADALARLQLRRRAHEIMLALDLRSEWKALDIARRELVFSLSAERLVMQ